MINDVITPARKDMIHWKKLWNEKNSAQMLQEAAEEQFRSLHLWTSKDAALLQELGAADIGRLFYALSFIDDSGYLSLAKMKYDRNYSALLSAIRKALAAGVLVEEQTGIRPIELFTGIGQANKFLSVDMELDGFAYWKISIQQLRHLGLFSATLSDFKTLGRCLQLLPYTNLRYNIVCHNLSESRLEKIRPMNTVEIAERLGCSRTNIDRVLKLLQRRRYLPNGYFTAADWMEIPYGGRGFIINPQLCRTSHGELRMLSIDWKWKIPVVDYDYN